MIVNQNNFNGTNIKNIQNKFFYNNYNKEMTPESKIYSYNVKRITPIKNDNFFDFHKISSNTLENVIHPRTIYAPIINKCKTNNSSFNKNYNNTSGKNNRVGLFKKYKPNMCTCYNLSSKSLNNNKPSRNNYYNIYNFNNTSFHMINQNKRSNSFNNNNNLNKLNNNNNLNYICNSFRNSTPINTNFYKNHSIVFISHLSEPKYENIIYTNQPKIKINNINIIKTIPKINLNNRNKNNLIKKAQTSRSYIDSPYINKNSFLNQDTHQEESIRKTEDNRNKFDRRFEITEITKVLLPNQPFKPKEIFEEKEGPIIEIKKNKNGSTTKIIKENLVKTTIENSIINMPKIDIGLNMHNVTFIKQKITKENITTIKSSSDILNSEKSNKIHNSLIYPDKINRIKHKLFFGNNRNILKKKKKSFNIKPQLNLINKEKNESIKNNEMDNNHINNNEMIKNNVVNKNNQINKSNGKNKINEVNKISGNKKNSRNYKNNENKINNEVHKTNGNDKKFDTHKNNENDKILQINKINVNDKNIEMNKNNHINKTNEIIKHNKNVENIKHIEGHKNNDNMKHNENNVNIEVKKDIEINNDIEINKDNEINKNIEFNNNNQKKDLLVTEKNKIINTNSLVNGNMSERTKDLVINGCTHTKNYTSKNEHLIRRNIIRRCITNNNIKIQKNKINKLINISNNNINNSNKDIKNNTSNITKNSGNKAIIKTSNNTEDSNKNKNDFNNKKESKKLILKKNKDNIFKIINKDKNKNNNKKNNIINIINNLNNKNSNISINYNNNKNNKKNKIKNITDVEKINGGINNTNIINNNANIINNNANIINNNTNIIKSNTTKKNNIEKKIDNISNIINKNINLKNNIIKQIKNEKIDIHKNINLSNKNTNNDNSINNNDNNKNNKNKIIFINTNNINKEKIKDNLENSRIYKKNNFSELKISKETEIYFNINHSKDMTKELNLKEINYPKFVNESQAISNIINVNNSTNTFNSLNKSETKLSNKIILDMPINIDLLDRDESDKSREEIEDSSEHQINKVVKQMKIKIGEKNLKISKFDKLADFINKLNNDELSKNIKNEQPNNNSHNNSYIKLPTESDNQKDEKLLNQMLISNINSSLKENDENENIESNKDDVNNHMKSSDNFENKNLTGSIMYINSNIDKNIHIKNGNENCSNNIYSNNINNNSSYNENNCFNNFNFAELEIDTPNNDQEYIDKLEIIKNSLSLQKNSHQKDETEVIDNNNEENEYESQNEEKFYKPLNKYENKFNLDQINPF